MDVLLIEAHYHIFVMTVECQVLTGIAIFQYHTFCTRLIVSFFLSFNDDFIYTCHCDVKGVLAITLNIVVIVIYTAVA